MPCIVKLTFESAVGKARPNGKTVQSLGEVYEWFQKCCKHWAVSLSLSPPLGRNGRSQDSEFVKTQVQASYVRILSTAWRIL